MTITPAQLKETNLIFSEHKKLLIENNLLYKQLDNYKTDNESLRAIDSLRVQQLNHYKTLSEVYQSNIDSLNTKIKRKEKSVKLLKAYGGTVSISFLLFLLFK